MSKDIFNDVEYCPNCDYIYDKKDPKSTGACWNCKTVIEPKKFSALQAKEAKEAMATLGLTKESTIRVIEVSQLKDWERRIDEAVNCLQDPEVLTHEDCSNDLEAVSHEIMSIKM